MLLNRVTIEAFEKGEIKKVGVITMVYDQSAYMIKECEVVKLLKFRNTYILRLKPWKGYQLGHKYLYRSIEEVI